MRPTLAKLIELTIDIKTALGVQSYELHYCNDWCYVEFSPRIINNVKELANITEGYESQILTIEQRLIVRVYEQDFEL